MPNDRRYLAAATFAGMSAALHLISLTLGGVAENLCAFAAGALLWSALAYGLARASRLVAYLAFLMGLSGSCVAFGMALGSSTEPLAAAWIGILVADALVALTLFMLLWRSRPS